MKEFAQILNGLDAESRSALIDSAEEFIRKRGDYDTCVFCGKSLTNLVCDAPIGFEMAGYKEPVVANLFNKNSSSGYRYVDGKSRMFTCDIPVCESCRTQGEPIFFCGGDVSFACGGGDCETNGGSEVFVPDLCPLHKGASSLGSIRDRVITEDESVAWRQRTLMLISEGKIKLVDIYPQGEEQ